MANDAEYTTMNDGQLANNSITFVNQLKAMEYFNVRHYFQPLWLTQTMLSPSHLGWGS